MENDADEWELDLDTDDIRGWPVRDLLGNLLGRVRKLLVDVDTQYIVEVVLDSGTHIPARELVIGDRFLRLHVPARPTAAETLVPPADTLPPFDVDPPRPR